MKRISLLAIILLCSNLAAAQFIKEKAISIQVGYGLSAPNNSIDPIVDDGFFAQGEYVMTITSWVAISPYAGVLFTSSNGEDIDGNPTNEKAETSAILLGGKVRLRAPIPWVAPYVEIGIGTSIGKFVTDTAFDDIDKGGIIYHIPFSFGLELGKNHNVDLGFVYYFQPTVEQYAGAFAVGITFPLNDRD
jgi:hypothetical protein